MRVLETLSWTEIAGAMSSRIVGEPQGSARGASIDTRTLGAGDIFFALKGEFTDGHDHVAAAVSKGAACAVVKSASERDALQGRFHLVVQDPEVALFELARLIRSKAPADIVAITGSAGKTTTKNFTAELLRAKGPVLATEGNLNNHLGVPLTLARLDTDDWAAVIECGMSHAGELSRLSQLLRPKVAAVTNIAAAHLEFFDSIDQIAKAKAEIFEGLTEGGTAVAPVDEPIVATAAEASSATTRLFGDAASTSARARNVAMTLEGSRFDLHLEGAGAATIDLKVPGPHAISNFLVAATIAQALGLSPALIAERAKLLRPISNRGGIKRLADDIVLIDDTYNSNPKALLASIDMLSLARDRRRVACLGDMLELGASGPLLHREAGAAIASKIDLLLSVGPLAKEIAVGAAALAPSAKRAFETSTDLASSISTLVKEHDAILVKGSRGMCMERVVDALMAAHPGAGA